MARGGVISATFHLYTELNKRRVTTTDRSWQHGKGEEQVGSWGVITKIQALPWLVWLSGLNTGL